MKGKLFAIILVLLNLGFNFALLSGNWSWALARKYAPKVALLDTGSNIDNINGVSFTGSSPFEDTAGHGTLMSKIILATNPNVDLYMVKVSETKGDFDAHLIGRGLRWCRENDIDIVSLSFTISEDYEVRREINLLTQRNITVVAAVGNVNSSWGFVIGSDNYVYSSKAYNNSIGFPANMDNVISVGALNFWGDKADFARSCGEISADGTWFGEKGTSVSTARLAGMVSLLKERYPDLSNTEIRQIIHSIAARKKKNLLLSKSLVQDAIKKDLAGYFNRSYEVAMKR